MQLATTSDGAPAGAVEQELARMREALRQSEERMGALLRSITDGFMMIARDWRISSINAQAVTLLRPGDGAEAPLPGRDLWLALPELRTPPFEPQLRHALEHRQSVDFELYHPPGKRWLEVRVHPTPEGLNCHLQDITARRAADDALRQSEEDLRALANAIPQLAWIAGPDGHMVWYNERWYAYTGSTPPAIGQTWPEVYDPACLPRMRARWRASLRTGQPFEMEFPIRGADGHFRWFLTRANPMRDSAGRPLRWFGTSTDVDQVKRAQEALREETTVLELLNSTGSALASTRDLHPLLREVTNAATTISGARFGAFLYHSGTAEDGAPRILRALSGQAPAAFLELGHSLGTASLRSADLSRDPRHAPYPAAAGGPPVRSFLAVPVVARSGALLGNLYLGHPEPDMFNERTQRIIGGIAAQAAVAIDNARLYAAAQRAAEERKVLLDSERCARAEAERTSQLKDEFLATLSHELRTPLTAILGWAQVLRRGSRDEADLHRGLQTIERNAHAQARLIEDLLDMSRITSGKVQLEVRAVAPLAVVQAAIETVRPAADAKQIRIDTQIESDPGTVAGDASRLQQIIWNLLTNAIKFTPREGAVSVRLARAQGQLEITVSDSGIGIRPEFLAHVFERFRQADASATRRHGGLGVGLSIVKHLVEQHGGTVAAASEGEGRGARFTVRLPLAGGSPPRPARHPDQLPLPGMAPPDLDGLRVLVVDDEADTRELITRILSDCHASVLPAACAAEALALLDSERPDVLVSDIGMPDMDGVELLERVRALGPARGGDLPAIALTAFVRPDDQSRALAGGFRAHLSKPVEPSALIAAVAAGAAAPRR